MLTLIIVAWVVWLAFTACDSALGRTTKNPARLWGLHGAFRFSLSAVPLKGHGSHNPNPVPTQDRKLLPTGPNGFLIRPSATPS
jgi:hypothetical protein